MALPFMYLVGIGRMYFPASYLAVVEQIGLPKVPNNAKYAFNILYIILCVFVKILSGLPSNLNILPLTRKN